MNAELPREFTVLIEQDEDGYYIAEVPELPSCYTQARSLDELMERVREVILLCMEDLDSTDAPSSRFVGIQRVKI